MRCFRFVMLGAAGSILLSSHATCKAEATINFGFESNLDMARPQYVPNIRAKNEFVILLKEDGSISEQYTGLSGTTRPDQYRRSGTSGYKLGQGLWHVVSQNVLVRTKSFPHN